MQGRGYLVIFLPHSPESIYSISQSENFGFGNSKLWELSEEVNNLNKL